MLGALNRAYDPMNFTNTIDSLQPDINWTEQLTRQYFTESYRSIPKPVSTIWHSD